jgi:hypothetical protein
MEFDADSQNFTTEDLVLQFKAPKPLWSGFGSSAIALDK